MSWTCDGVPKHNPEKYNGTGPHQPCDNDGSFCMCGLPEEAMVDEPPKPPTKPILMALAGVLGVLVLGGGGFGLYKAFSGKSPDSTVTTGGGTSTPTITASPGDLISSKAVSAALISQGEKILLTGGKADA
ncbi:hypothetical protein WME70_32165, partial [Microcoleus anatoxicus PTRS1]